ncbi:hypothetical protein ACHAXS_001785 [Conticribra weissflogii]
MTQRNPLSFLTDDSENPVKGYDTSLNTFNLFF